jgi:hypothetical protein
VVVEVEVVDLAVEAEAEVVVLPRTIPARLVSVVEVDSAYLLEANLHRESFHQLCLPWTTRHRIAGQVETLNTVLLYVHTKNVWHKH